jgi:hypothetical protein
MPKGLRILPISFEEQYLTHFAGMLFIQRFCQKLGIKHLLQQHLRPAPRFRDFHPSEMILAILYAIIAGMERVNETQILQYNYRLALPRHYHFQSTFERALARVQKLKRLNPAVLSVNS